MEPRQVKITLVSNLTHKNVLTDKLMLKGVQHMSENGFETLGNTKNIGKCLIRTVWYF